MKVKNESEVAQSCPTLCDPMDCSLPGFSVQGIFQARVLEWVAITFSNPHTSVTLKTFPKTHCLKTFPKTHCLGKQRYMNLKYS